jgi:glycine oxidase
MGLMCARELSKRGLKVRVLERGVIGREASWAGGGILSPLYPWRSSSAIWQLSQRSGELYAKLALELLQETGIDSEWQQSGMLWLALSDLEEACAFLRSQALLFEVLEHQEIQRRWPLLVHREGKSLWVPSICQIRNPQLLKALKRKVAVSIEENTQVVGLKRRKDRVVAALTSKGEIEADVFIITQGAWSAQLRLNALKPRISPVKGQMLLFKATDDLLSCIVQRDEHYLIPRRDGRILVGSTVEAAGFDKRPSRLGYFRLYEFAIKTLPALEYFPVELHWAGLRPFAEDGIPYIGQHPELENLFYNCGHFRNGVTMAPAATELLVDLILGEPPKVDPSPYLPRNRRDQFFV